MHTLETLYAMAIGVIVVIAFMAALHPEVPTGIIGTTLLCGIALCNLAAIERFGETPNWRALLTILEASLAVFVAVKWARSRP
jgi:L-asparagine transporter-like permease